MSLDKYKSKDSQIVTVSIAENEERSMKLPNRKIETFLEQEDYEDKIGSGSHTPNSIKPKDIGTMNSMSFMFENSVKAQSKIELPLI